MGHTIAIAIGGALGALSRYWTVGWVSVYIESRFPQLDSFPFGTLVVNILGSLLIGVSYVLIVEKMHLTPHWQAIVMVGFLGAFTTFSTFSLETLVLLQDGRYAAGFGYILASVLICLIAVMVGMWATKQMI